MFVLKNSFFHDVIGSNFDTLKFIKSLQHFDGGDLIDIHCHSISSIVESNMEPSQSKKNYEIPTRMTNCNYPTFLLDITPMDNDVICGGCQYNTPKRLFVTK